MPVLTELATMTEASQGTSIARFGHGELRIMHGKDARFQKYDKKLADELWKISEESPCLVCMPHTRGKRGWEWEVFLETYGKPIKQGRWYGSSFVWRFMPFSYPGHHINPKKENSYDFVDRYEETMSLWSGRREPILISMGPAATVLADRLARKGIWALDLGNIGQFL